MAGRGAGLPSALLACIPTATLDPVTGATQAGSPTRWRGILDIGQQRSSDTSTDLLSLVFPTLSYNTAVCIAAAAAGSGSGLTDRGQENLVNVVGILPS